MSVETATLEDLGRELGEKIADSPEHEAFVEANEAVENNAEAQEKIKEFEQLRHEFMVDREAGRADRESMREVKRAQRELHALPVMEEYLDAQEALQERLESVNMAISEELAVDFGGEAGGCCQD
ncbi:YlbF family regulator [Halohasta salina]|uniref:YlbF family regulator n=1 Tax=Halohasta salina TaxID=2961621 RepID=UPI0020A41CFC|nr:YlbF family regulator [Halohasta salina]